SPAPEQLAPSSPAPSLVFDQSYEYVGEVEYFDDPVSIDRRRFSYSYPSIRRSYRTVIPRFSSAPFFYRYRRSPGVIIKFGVPVSPRRFYSQPFRRPYGFFRDRFRH
ncbi:MAG: hypothetical protein HC919_11325, partial [Oscillatoriales cyanobacterium SM2_2_1]|nr:hypothetical protein [Oscillatoriales cyanobacterium SM2_2_1]